MGVDAGSVYSSIRIRLTDLDNDLKGVYARLGQLESNITKTTVPAQKNFKDMFLAVASGQAVLELAKKGFAFLTESIKDSIRVATESQEMISKYDVVFSGMGSASEDAAKTFSKSFDLAGATAKEMLSNTGNLLQGMGATKEESLDLSLKVNTLASDLASFTNNQGGASAASEALTKALLGEKESMKTLGIAILDSDVNARLAANGQDKLTGTALKLAKAQATLQLITEQSKNAIGDYARTQDSAANTQKRAEESTKKLQIAVGTALNPAVTLTASLWAKISSSLAEVITKQTELANAEKAIKEGTATTEQRILALKNQKKELESIRTTSYYMDIDGKRYASDQAKSDSAEIALTQSLIDTLTRQAAIEKGIAAAKSKADADALAKEQAKAKQIQDTLDAYTKERDIVTGILKDNESDYQKIQNQIDSINLAWAAGTILEEDRQKALKILTDKQDKLNDAKKAMIATVNNLGKAEESESVKAKNALIEQVKAMGLLPEQEQLAIDKIEEYYAIVEKKESFNKFAKNASIILSTATSMYSAYADLVNQLNKNEVEEQERALDKETKALTEALEERQKLETDYLTAQQDAEDEALKSKYDNVSGELDSELQAKLYSLGLADAATTEQYKNELDKAIATGDATTIQKAQEAYDKSVIEEDYAARQKALKEQQAAEQLALDKKQADDKAALEKKQAAEKTALDEAQAKKKAEIEYRAALTSWQMQLTLAIASAAQAVLAAFQSGMAYPFIGPATGAAFAAAAAVTGAIQVAAVRAAKPVLAYATGGIVPGSSPTGDLIQANVNSGEMILTTGQQAKLFALINGNGGGGSTTSQNIFQIGTVIGNASGLRELNRLLAKYGSIENKRTGS